MMNVRTLLSMMSCAFFALAFQLSFAAPAPSSCPNGTLSYWTFDDPDDPGKDDYDGHDGQVEGAVWQSSQVRGGLYFSSAQRDGVYIGDVRPLASSSSGSVTYTFWGKPSPLGQVQTWKGYPFSDKQGDLKCALSATSEGQSPEFSVAAIIYSSGWRPYYVWVTPVYGDRTAYHHVACVYDSDRLHVYFDGVRVNSADVPNGISDAANSNPLVIGRQGPSSRPFDLGDGYMDEVAVFDRALTAEEINRMYRHGLAGAGYCAEAVPIDFKPGSCPNQIRSVGVMPAAIVGTEAVPVDTIDPMTVRLARLDESGEPITDESGEPILIEPLRWGYDDVATPFDGELCGCGELESDGTMDLNFIFRSAEVAAGLGLLEEPNVPVKLVLIGNLLSQNSDEVGPPIQGEDCMMFRSKKK
jgi:hypothetical protein